MEKKLYVVTLTREFEAVVLAGCDDEADRIAVKVAGDAADEDGGGWNTVGCARELTKPSYFADSVPFGEPIDEDGSESRTVKQILEATAPEAA